MRLSASEAVKESAARREALAGPMIISQFHASCVRRWPRRWLCHGPSELPQLCQLGVATVLVPWEVDRTLGAGQASE
jgi:hypothetical protein